MGGKKVVIVTNAYKDESVLLGKRIKTFLEKKHIDSDIFEFSNSSADFSFSDYDFAITLGGDGTVLFAARGCLDYGVPIFPVNLGKFGFISGIQKEEWEHSLQLFLDGKLHVTERTMLSVSVYSDKKEFASATALNDVIISAGVPAKLVSLDIEYNQIPFGKYEADGVIIATPTGSTAYSAAAGGPIVDPELECFIVNPICPFSLSNRPVVLPATGSLVIKVLPSRETPVTLSADGQVSVPLKTGDTVVIKKADKKVLLVNCTSDIFYGALKSKLHWSGGPHA